MLLTAEQLLQESNEIHVHSLLVLTETALTFLDVAETTLVEQTRARCLRLCWRACVAALRLIPRFDLTDLQRCLVYGSLLAAQERLEDTGFFGRKSVGEIVGTAHEEWP